MFIIAENEKELREMLRQIKQSWKESRTHHEQIKNINNDEYEQQTHNKIG